jgi:hypothetical protein
METRAYLDKCGRAEPKEDVRIRDMRMRKITNERIGIGRLANKEMDGAEYW